MEQDKYKSLKKLQKLMKNNSSIEVLERVKAIQYVTESNKIEGITGYTEDEISEFLRFIKLEVITIKDLQQFVSVYQPDAKLRDNCTVHNVQIGYHRPLNSGPEVRVELERILKDIDEKTPFEVHCEYEKLHPFTDGNGRSGRVIWYWMMQNKKLSGNSFLHTFYYQTLSEYHKIKRKSNLASSWILDKD